MAAAAAVVLVVAVRVRDVLSFTYANLLRALPIPPPLPPPSWGNSHDARAYTHLYSAKKIKVCPLRDMCAYVCVNVFARKTPPPSPPPPRSKISRLKLHLKTRAKLSGINNDRLPPHQPAGGGRTRERKGTKEKGLKEAARASTHSVNVFHI